MIHTVRKTRTAWVALALAPIVALTACAGDGAAPTGVEAAGLESGLGGRAESRSITFLLSQDPGDPFWSAISQGAKDAAELFNVELNLQTSSGDQDKYNDLIGSAVASKPAGLAVVLDDPSRYTETVCAAKEAGIPVMSYNITQGGEVGECVLGFVGQDFEETGFLLGQRLIQEAGLESGDVVFTPVEFPEQVYAVQRHAGVQRALDEVGAKSDLGPAIGIESSAALDRLTQYLLGHQDVAAIAALGGVPLKVAVTAMEDSGVKVPVVGFDLAPEIIQGIESGDIIAAADQQPYIQGFQPVAQLAMLLDFGLSPAASINSGGAGLVDASNVGLASELAGKVR